MPEFLDPSDRRLVVGAVIVMFLLVGADVCLASRAIAAGDRFSIELFAGLAGNQGRVSLAAAIWAIASNAGNLRRTSFRKKPMASR